MTGLNLNTNTGQQINVTSSKDVIFYTGIIDSDTRSVRNDHSNGRKFSDSYLPSFGLTTGIAIGSVLGIILSILVVVLVVRRKNSKRREETQNLLPGKLVCFAI